MKSHQARLFKYSKISYKRLYFKTLVFLNHANFVNAPILEATYSVPNQPIVSKLGSIAIFEALYQINKELWFKRSMVLKNLFPIL